jgi:hypothetical protein
MAGTLRNISQRSYRLQQVQGADLQQVQGPRRLAWPILQFHLREADDMSKFVRSTFLLSVIAVAATVALLVQGGATGTILGTVTDNTGSVVAGASVTSTSPPERHTERKPVQQGITVCPICAGTFQPGPFSSATGNPGNLNQYHFKYFGPYIQDDWKTTERLTLNVGLRWDYRAVPYETNDKLFWIDTANQAGGLCYANKALLTDGVAPAGNGFYRYCGRHNPKDGSKTPFAPRLGFAYRPFGDDTVIRGGYGIYFDSSETREMDNSGDLYPYVIRASLSPAIQAVPKLTDQLFPVASALHPVSAATEGGSLLRSSFLRIQSIHTSNSGLCQ